MRGRTGFRRWCRVVDAEHGGSLGVRRGVGLTVGRLSAHSLGGWHLLLDWAEVLGGRIGVHHHVAGHHSCHRVTRRRVWVLGLRRLAKSAALRRLGIGVDTRNLGRGL